MTVILHYGQIKWQTDRVNLVRVMVKQTPLSERVKELPADAKSRKFPSYLKCSTSHSGQKKINRDWIIYSSSKGPICLPYSYWTLTFLSFVVLEPGMHLFHSIWTTLTSNCFLAWSPDKDYGVMPVFVLHSCYTINWLYLFLLKVPFLVFQYQPLFSMPVTFLLQEEV